ncbi:MAG: hypothetical protein AVDCRST_MAG93-769, partial [uncultured Chloroflexia bacterium]
VAGGSRGDHRSPSQTVPTVPRIRWQLRF